MELADVYEAIRNDPRWDQLRSPGTSLVPGRGNSTDPLAMIVGVAPSAHDSLKRKVFTGPNGLVLKQLMELAGLYAEDDACTGGCGDQHAQYDCPHREDHKANAFLTNLVKYTLPGNREPNGREMFRSIKSLRDEWTAIARPRLIVTLGVAGLAFAATDKNQPIPVAGDWVALKDGKTFVWYQNDPRIAQDQEDQEIIESQWEAMGEWIRSSL